VRTGIGAALLSVDDIKVVGEAADGEEAVRVCDEVRPDVVIMDLKLPQADGITAIHRLRKRNPEVQVLALTTYPDEFWVQEALFAGATSYLLKNGELDSLVAAIRATHKGRTTLSPELSRVLVYSTIRRPSNGRASAQAADLSKREMEVLALLLEGLRNQQIADRLGITSSTVSYHTRRLYTKLGASTPAEIVAETIQRRLMDTSRPRSGATRLTRR
jgi:DNA-binding NarL/FixJ family response regulator